MSSSFLNPVINSMPSSISNISPETFTCIVPEVPSKSSISTIKISGLSLFTDSNQC